MGQSSHKRRIKHFLTRRETAQKARKSHSRTPALWWTEKWILTLPLTASHFWDKQLLYIITHARGLVQLSFVSVCLFPFQPFSVHLNMAPTIVTSSIRILIRGFSKKTSIQKLWREKANMQNQSSLLAIFTRTSYLKDDWYSRSCCFQRIAAGATGHKTSEISLVSRGSSKICTKGCALLVLFISLFSNISIIIHIHHSFWCHT